MATVFARYLGSSDFFLFPPDTLLSKGGEAKAVDEDALKAAQAVPGEQFETLTEKEFIAESRAADKAVREAQAAVARAVQAEIDAQHGVEAPEPEPAPEEPEPEPAAEEASDK